MAFLGIDPAVLDHVKSMSDFQQLEQEFQMKKQLALGQLAASQATVAKALMPKQSNLDLLVAHRDSLSPDDPNRPIYDAAITKETTVANPFGTLLAGLDPATGETKYGTPQQAVAGGIVPIPKPERHTAGIDAVTGESRFGTDAEISNGRLLPPSAKAAVAKPLPPQALKMQNEGLDIIGTASSINADLGGIMKQIDDGKLDLGLTSNALNTAQNYLGMSDEKSRNFASFKSSMEQQRNASLRLNKGVQTDGDAQRAWNELFANINDTAQVKQRLGEIQRINERGADLQKLNVDNIRANYGAEPMDYSGYQNVPSALNGGTAPSGLPQGSKLVGTSGGKPVYELPDGRHAVGR